MNKQNESKLKAIIVIIDDDRNLKDTNIGLFTEMEEEFTPVLFDNKKDAMEYIKENFADKRIIVMLDLSFPANMADGHEILKSIRELSFLIPVIIWSAVDEEKQRFSDLINNKAYAFLSKEASTAEIINKLREAYSYSENSVSVALENWIEAHSEEDREKPFSIQLDGKILTLNELLKDVRQQSSKGKDFSEKLLRLTLDLLARNKESLK